MRHHGTFSTAAALLVLLLAVLTPCEAASSSGNRQQLKRGDHDDLQAGGALFEVTDSTLSAATTGCGLCQQRGLCDHAFKGTPGQFCLTLASGLPCCCPQDNAQCAATPYSCRCRRSTYSSGGGHPVKVVTRTSSTTSSEGAKSFSLFSLFAMLLCVCCCCCAIRKRNERPEPEPYHQPVYAAPVQYGATNQANAKYPYAYASAPPPDSYNNTPYARPADSGSGNSYTAGAMGGVAGLAGGMLIGSMLGGGSGNRAEPATTTTTTYFDGDSGYGNTSSNDYFGGDTGGGGDYGGDYGGDGGGDFGGDS